MKQTKPTSIRLDEALYDRIKEEAESENRSISGQIEYIIKKYFQTIDNLKIGK